MVKVRLIAVGKVKEKYYVEAFKEYEKRLGRFCDFTLVEVKEENFDKPDGAAIEKIMQIEGQRIKSNVKGYSIAFAVEGKKTSSEGLANILKKLIDGGTGEISFIIGGSYGIAESVKNSCKEKLSFSDMTFPHTLARVMAVEQIYRAFTIISGAEYHK